MNLSQRLRTCAKHTGLDAVIELLTEAADEIDRLSAGEAADVTDERQAFEKWLGIRPCGAAHDLAWSAWKARTALSQQPATPEPVLFIHPDTFAMNNAQVGAWKPGYELTGYIPLYTHPAQNVPADVVRDAERGGSHAN